MYTQRTNCHKSCVFRESWEGGDRRTTDPPAAVVAETVVAVDPIIVGGWLAVVENYMSLLE